MRYSLYGLCIESDARISQLKALSGCDNPDLSLHFIGEGAPSPIRQAEIRWFESRYKTAAGIPYLVIYRSQDSTALELFYRLEFEDGVAIVLDLSRATALVYWPDHYSIADVAINVMGPFLGFYLKLRGLLTLHGSAIEVGGTAVAFVGQGGAGKSTTAAAFASRGFPIISDDILVVKRTEENFVVFPAYPQLALYPQSIQGLFGEIDDSFSLITPNNKEGWDKHYLDLKARSYRFQDEPLPVRAIYLLRPRSLSPSAPNSVKLNAYSAMSHLLGGIYGWRLPAVHDRGSEFETLADIASEVPVSSLTPSADIAKIDDLCAVVLADLERSPET